MGYACPVCDDPQADAGHLANHLAFTAMTGGDDHEAWLDERVPGWGQLGEDELSGEVVEYAEETEFPQMFEDTVDRSGGGHDHDHDHGDLPAGASRHRGKNALRDQDSEVLAEARELTRAMLDEDDESDDSDGSADSADADAERDQTDDGDETQ
ncbi:DUF5810 domain-containing protein [Haloarcula salina]|uniref:Uncharacterized protein n=1 Tax=Haloarcula salina TaxID=1429914 RepID=A0AA41GBK7_9EURY|nr:DUF5810 domain-containing protein [Haloarcula salina]MBV0903742.1 hypothetical protein [Haloarcula salina]